MSNIHGGKILPLGWFVYATEDGRPYFHNRNTGSTQWDPPSEIDSRAADLSFNTQKNITVNNVLETRDPIHPIASPLDPLGQNLIFTLGEEVFLPETKPDNFLSMEGEISGLFNTPTGVPGTSCALGLDTTSKPPSDKFSGALSWVFNLDLFKPYFDVETSTILMRIKRTLYVHELIKAYRGSEDGFYSGSVLPSPTYLTDFDDFKRIPDFYGPFWISTTAIVCLFIFSHISHLLVKPYVFNTNYQSLVILCFLVYGFVVFVPLLVWAVQISITDSTHPSTLSFSQLITVYGYSLTFLIPLSAISIVPYMSVRWGSMLCSFFFSYLFVLLSLRRDLNYFTTKTKMTLLSVLFGAHLCFHFILILHYFYNV